MWRRDQYEAAAALGNALIDGQCDMPQIYREAGMANFAINNLDRTLEILEKAEATSSLSGDARDCGKRSKTTRNSGHRNRNCVRRKRLPTICHASN